MGIFNLLKQIFIISNTNRLSPAVIRAIQQKKLKKLVQYAVKHSKFYQKFYHGIDVNNFKLEQLPVLSKKLMMENFDQVVTDSRITRAGVEKFFSVQTNLGKKFQKKYVCVHTSGTTGEKAIIVYKKADFDVVEALGLARAQQSPFNPAGLLKLLRPSSILKILKNIPMRFAAIINTHGHHTSHLSLIHQYANNPLMIFRAYTLFTPKNRLVQELNAFQPKMIGTYATCVETLSQEQLSGRLNICLDSPLSTLGSFGEALTPKVRDLAKQAFHMPVDDAYGATECIEMARDCAEHHLHIYSDFVILESVDEMNRPVPLGQIGSKVLMTNLYNNTTPLIRYEISDMLMMSPKPCACGSPLPYIQKIMGRKNDSFYFRNTKGTFEEVKSWNFVSTIVNLDNIMQGQIVQPSYDKIIMRFVPWDGVKLDVPGIIRQQKQDFADLHLDPNIKVEVEIVDEIPRDPVSQKYRPVIRQVPVPEEFVSKDPEQVQPASKPTPAQIVYTFK